MFQQNKNINKKKDQNTSDIIILFWIKILEYISESKNEKGITCQKYMAQVTQINTCSYHIHVGEILVLKIELNPKSDLFPIIINTQYAISGGNILNSDHLSPKFKNNHPEILWKYSVDFTQFHEEDKGEILSNNINFSSEIQNLTNKFQELSTQMQEFINLEKQNLQKIIQTQNEQKEIEWQNRINEMIKTSTEKLKSEFELSLQNFLKQSEKQYTIIESEYNKKKSYLDNYYSKLLQSQDEIHKKNEELEGRKRIFEDNEKSDIKQLICILLARYNIDPLTVKTLRIDVEALLNNEFAFFWAKKAILNGE